MGSIAPRTRFTEHFVSGNVFAIEFVSGNVFVIGASFVSGNVFFKCKIVTGIESLSQKRYCDDT